MLKFNRFIQSLKYSYRGLYKAFWEEQNLKVQSSIALIVIIFGFIFKLGRFEWMALLFAILLVILTELINSSVERIADALKPRIDKYVKDIKDIMAGAVLLSAIISIIVGLLVFYPHINSFF